MAAFSLAAAAAAEGFPLEGLPHERPARPREGGEVAAVAAREQRREGEAARVGEDWGTMSVAVAEYTPS